jgi:hypothetical protein
MPDTHDGTSHTMDTGLSQSQTADLLFPSTIIGSHLDLDLSSVQHSSPHVVHNLQSSFLNKADSLPATLHVSPPATLSEMDILNSTSLAQDHIPNFIPEFPPQNDPFRMQVLGGEPLQPNSIAPHVSNNPSQLPSEDANSIPIYTIGTSSLASALDVMERPLRRSPPESSIPNGLGLSSAESGPSTSVNSSGFLFTPSDYHSDCVEAKGESPDVPNDPHRLVVVNLFQE